MKMYLFHLGLSLSLGFMLLVPVARAVKAGEVAQTAASAPPAGEKEPAPPVGLRAVATPTACEARADCVSFFDDVLGLSMDAPYRRSDAIELAGHDFSCQRRESDDGRGRIECRAETNDVDEATHEQILTDLLTALRDRHGAERSVRSTRQQVAVEHTWDWGSRRNGDKRRTLRVKARWRYNPTGLGVPNVVRFSWQTVTW